jgi:hypothetical protein
VNIPSAQVKKIACLLSACTGAASIRRSDLPKKKPVLVELEALDSSIQRAPQRWQCSRPDFLEFEWLFPVLLGLSVKMYTAETDQLTVLFAVQFHGSRMKSMGMMLQHMPCSLEDLLLGPVVYAGHGHPDKNVPVVPHLLGLAEVLPDHHLSPSPESFRSLFFASAGLWLFSFHLMGQHGLVYPY